MKFDLIHAIDCMCGDLVTEEGQTGLGTKCSCMMTVMKGKEVDTIRTLITMVDLHKKLEEVI